MALNQNELKKHSANDVCTNADGNYSNLTDYVSDPFQSKNSTAIDADVNQYQEQTSVSNNQSQIKHNIFDDFNHLTLI